jgi:hypothetical protein
MSEIVMGGTQEEAWEADFVDEDGELQGGPRNVLRAAFGMTEVSNLCFSLLLAFQELTSW